MKVQRQRAVWKESRRHQTQKVLCQKLYSMVMKIKVIVHLKRSQGLLTPKPLIKCIGANRDDKYQVALHAARNSIRNLEYVHVKLVPTHMMQMQ